MVENIEIYAPAKLGTLQRRYKQIVVEESSSDQSSEDFKDFIKITARRKVVKSSSVVFRRNLKRISARIQNRRSGLHEIGDRLNSSSDSEESNGKMQYRSNSASSSRNGSTCFYSSDFHRRYKMRTREPKSQIYVNCVTQ